MAHTTAGALAHRGESTRFGTSRETVTRLFSDLQKRRIVQADGSALVIRNQSALKLIACNHIEKPLRI
jgi:CRP-like cAMP-binding protein